jgi:hypothetical protein
LVEGGLPEVGGMSGERKHFGPEDVVVGDWAWGVGAWLPHPVIRVNRESITIGIHRDRGCWLTTQILRWGDVRGVIPAEVDQHLDVATAVRAAADRVRGGSLSAEHRESLADLLLIAATQTLPTPVTAGLHNAITALTRPDRTPPPARP